MNIVVIPAIDLLDGKCVRLTQGDYDRSKVYSSDPVTVAKMFEDAGAKRLHLVDLDGAKASKPANLSVLERITSQTGLTVEFGGGVKSEASLQDVWNAGAEYAICGSIAVTKPEEFRSWAEKAPGKIILGLDLKNGLVATHGWLKTSEMEADDVLLSFSDVISQAIVTEIAHDGMLEGVDVEFYSGLQSRFPKIEIIVSGGVSGKDDILALDDAGLKAAIVGKAIYEEKVNVNELFR